MPPLESIEPPPLRGRGRPDGEQGRVRPAPQQQPDSREPERSDLGAGGEERVNCGGKVRSKHRQFAKRRRSHPQGILTRVSPFGAESFATTRTSPIFRAPWPSCVLRAGPRL